jgi:hypothetical protein
MLETADRQTQYEVLHNPQHGGRVICIGLNQRHDWAAMHQIADWCESNGYRSIYSAIAVDDLDHYDMSIRPEKGDALDAIRRHKDVIAVIALHLFGLDKPPIGRANDDTYFYTKENHKLLDLCMNRSLPLICWGDQPLNGGHVQRYFIGKSLMFFPRKAKDNGSTTTQYPIYLYKG